MSRWALVQACAVTLRLHASCSQLFVCNAIPGLMSRWGCMLLLGPSDCRQRLPCAVQLFCTHSSSCCCGVLGMRWPTAVPPALMLEGTSTAPTAVSPLDKWKFYCCTELPPSCFAGLHHPGAEGGEPHATPAPG